MKIRIQLNRTKIAKRISREKFGRPGQGRKTAHIDRKKKENKERCKQEIDSE